MSANENDDALNEPLSTEAQASEAQAAQAAKADVEREAAAAAAAAAWAPESVSLETAIALRKAGMRQIWFGLAWWTASSIAMGVALANTDSNILWFGGLIGAGFNWFRAYKLFSQANIAEAPKLKLTQFWNVGLTLVVVAASAIFVAPEWIHVENPGVGTCYGDVGDGFVPVACYSPSAGLKVIATEQDSANCPAESFDALEPTNAGEDYFCVIQTSN